MPVLIICKLRLSDRNPNHFQIDKGLPAAARCDAPLILEWQTPAPPQSDLELRGARYLDALRQLAPDPSLVELPGEFGDRIKMCGWIGLNIHRVNLRLQALLQACEECLHPTDRPPVQILAAPLAADRGLDGICNIQIRPMTLLIDVGRVMPPDWLGAVAHEYAHAAVGAPGHDSRFQAMITHLCLGLGLLPPPTSRMGEGLASWPPYRPAAESAQFWLGQSTPFAF